MNLSDKNNIGKPCPKCRRTITKEVHEKIVQIKVLNGQASSKKAQLNGTTYKGRPSKLDWDQVIYLRSKYMTKSDIAKKLGVARSWLSMGCTKRGIL